MEGVIYAGNQLPRAFTELDETSVLRLAYDILRAATGPFAHDKFVETVHSLLSRVLDVRRPAPAPATAPDQP